MAQVIMSNSGSNTNANMRMGITYNVGVGYVQITGMYGCRYDSYNTSGSPCTVYTNGGYAKDISSAHGTSVGTFRANSSKNTTLTNTSYWRAWGAGSTIYTSSSSLTLTFTFACSATANIANAKFTTTITGIPQPYTPVISAVTTSNITRTSVNYSWSITDLANGYAADKYIDLFNNSNCADSAKLNTGYDYTGSFSGLSANTTYYLRANASNGTYRGYSAVKSFTTTGNAPTITERDSTIGRKYARLGWNISYDTNASWGDVVSNVYGTSTSYGSNASTDSYNNRFYGGTSEETGVLQPNTTYYYSFQQKDNWGRVSNTLTGSFTTLGNAPTVVFKEVRAGTTEATVDFSYTMDTNASLSSYSIDYGLTTSYGSTSNKMQLTGLKPKSTYYFRITVTDNWGRSGTYTGSFETLSADATGYIKGYVDGQGVVWQRGTVYIKKNDKWYKGRKVRGKAGGKWYGNS